MGLHAEFLVASLLISSLGIPYTSATLSPSQWQQQIIASTANDWGKYVRSPPSEITRPVRVLSNYTVGNVTNPDGILTGKGSTILSRTPATATGADTTPMIVVDWGQNLAGFLSINFGESFNTSTGLPGIRLAFSETLEYLTLTSDFSRSYNGDSITPGSDQIAVLPDPYTWTDSHGCEYGSQVCADGFHGFRYMKVYLDALPADSPYTSAYGQVSINSMSLNFTGYLGTSDTFTGWFESSDDQLNQWWYDGVYTNDMCIDTFRVNDTEPRSAASLSLIGKLVLHDGAKRDRDPYVGDLAVSARTSYVSHNVPLAARNVLADLADHQRSDGWIPPASINSYTLPLLDYPMWWVACSYDLFVYTGDTDYIIKYYPNIVLLLDTFYPSVTDSTTQLLSKAIANADNYGDYAFLPRHGAVTYYNALYVMALKNAASIAQFLGGHDVDAARWTARAEIVSAAINEYRFDSSVGAFFDGDCGSSPCPTHAQDGNSLAILSGAVNSTIATSALSYLSSKHARPYGNSFYDNDYLDANAGFSQRVYAFISYFEIQARFVTNLADSALEEIRRLYGWMSSHDPEITMWEGIGGNGSLYEGAYTSMAHGWSTGIVPALTNYVLGVIPTSPGFQAWSIKPYPGDILWAKGAVPTPTGQITVSWNNNPIYGLFYLTGSAPSGTKGIISVPVSNSSVVVYFNGNVAWDGTVTQSTGGGNEGGYFSLPVDGGSFTISVGFNTAAA